MTKAELKNRKFAIIQAALGYNEERRDWVSAIDDFEEFPFLKNLAIEMFEVCSGNLDGLEKELKKLNDTTI